MTEKKVILKITSSQSETAYDDEDDGEETPEGAIETDVGTLEMTTEAVMRSDDSHIEIEYDESELTGMKGCVTKLYFEFENPSLVSMLRGGEVRAALVFEPKMRHICVYNVGPFPLEMEISTKTVKNGITEYGGTLELEYSVEFQSSGVHETSFRMEVRT